MSYVLAIGTNKKPVNPCHPAVVPSGATKGTYHGKVAIRANGYLTSGIARGTIQGSKHSHFKRIQKSDGYSYTYLPARPLCSKERSFRTVQGDFK